MWTLIADFSAVSRHVEFIWALLKPLTMFVVLMSVFSFLFTGPV